MLIASYNPRQIGDVLLLVLGPDQPNQRSVRKGNVVALQAGGQTVGYNIFNASELLPKLKGQVGHIGLSKAEITTLNEVLQSQGFSDRLPLTSPATFVVGQVNVVKPHPQSTHLQITETEVQAGKVLQIVSGSPNIKTGIKVVVAEVGAMMPNGQLIWPSKLKDVESDGMICSGRELRIPHAPDKPGALILPANYQVGDPFDFEQAATLFNE